MAKDPFTPVERRAVTALASLYCFRMLGLFMVLPLLSVYAAGLPGATAQTIGLALGAYGLTQAALQLPLGWLSDRIGRRPVILAGLGLFVAGSAVAGLAEDIEGIILGRFLQGGGAIAAALTALAADYTRDSQRTKTMAIIGASVGLSFVLALVLGPVLAAMGGLPLVFMVTAGMGSLGLVLVAFVLPARPQNPAAVEPGDWEASHIFGGGLPIIYASIFLLHGMLMATFLLVPRMLTEHFDFAADRHWMLYLATVLLSLPPALVLMRKGRGDNPPRPLLMLGVLPLVLGSLTALNATAFWLVAVGMVLFFAGVTALEAMLPATVSRLAPGRLRGTAMGIYATAQFLGIFAGGSLGGVIVASGGVDAVSLVVLALGLIWLVLLSQLQVGASEPVTLHE